MNRIGATTIATCRLYSIQILECNWCMRTSFVSLNFRNLSKYSYTSTLYPCAIHMNNGVKRYGIITQCYHLHVSDVADDHKNCACKSDFHLVDRSNEHPSVPYKIKGLLSYNNTVLTVL